MWLHAGSGRAGGDAADEDSALRPTPNVESYTITFGTLRRPESCMSWVEIIVLAIVQGLTEFIPISSTAHLRIVPALFGWEDPGAAFSAVLQIGTLAAVLWYFWRDVARILSAMLSESLRGRLGSTQDGRLGWMIAAGTLPIILCGLVFRAHIETTLRSLAVMAGALAGVAVLLAIAEWAVRRRAAAGIHGRELRELTWRDAIAIGIAQAAALVPGTSRSGVTILGGLHCGLTREAAARFSFLLSIPSILAAGVFQLVDAREELLASTSQAMKLLVALVVTAVVGYATIPWLLGYLRRRTMLVFIVYRLLLAGLLVLLIVSGRIR
jgi:undecaprenyl-diphosphatase